MWWIILLSVLSLFTLILMSRLVMEIDSTRDVYAVKFGRLLSACLLLHDEVPSVSVRFLWWETKLGLTGNAKVRDSEEKQKPLQRRRRGSIRPARVIRKLKGMLASFRITQCFISIDTGNMPLNGMLFPWFYLLGRRTGKKVMINFEGHTIVILRIENTIARLLWAYIKS